MKKTAKICAHLLYIYTTQKATNMYNNINLKKKTEKKKKKKKVCSPRIIDKRNNLHCQPANIYINCISKSQNTTVLTRAVKFHMSAPSERSLQ